MASRAVRAAAAVRACEEAVKAAEARCAATLRAVSAEEVVKSLARPAESVPLRELTPTSKCRNEVRLARPAGSVEGHRPRPEPSASRAARAFPTL